MKAFTINGTSSGTYPGIRTEVEEPLPRRWPKVGGVTPGSFARECQGVPPVVDDVKPLPKPARVEKWQRWRGATPTECLVSEIVGETARLETSDNVFGIASTVLLRARDWTFLGYAKPDKVEVGQRWRNYTTGAVTDVMVRECENDQVWFGDSAYCRASAMIASDRWEYLGMAESTDPEQAADRLHAEIHADDKREPITKRVDLFGRPMPGTKSVIGPPARDPKAEARRANEEAAKRLIANPPEWAYPKAWMCAVLAAQEWNNSHTVVPGMELSAIGWWIAVVCELEHRGRERSATIDGIATVVRDAYARGMERHPPMTRQGIKRGISTCDMGGEYE